MAKVLIYVMAGWMVAGQTPAELYAVEEYREWAGRQRAGGDLLERYRGYLLERGADSVDAETTIRVIRRLEGSPSGFLVEVLRGRKPGKALEVTRGGGQSAAWLEGQGWAVTAVDVTKANRSPFGEGQWDLIVLETGVGVEKAEVIGRSLRVGGRLVVAGREAFPGLRMVKEGDGRRCWERTK